MMNVVADEKVRAAARWLSEQSPVPAHVINFIKTKFELSALQACEACKLAQEYRSRR
ncbi:hypothetical protein ABIA14_003041 [Sinorhizobium fredii]|uniref:hypothetical protein n=2 Tax=Rhizobium fredii TaxID=380 RepID=UPI0002E961C9|nr:hypothetical protein [Sinorhizobium fredii]AWM23425.1 hypothetical protein AOX55_0000140 [Sinorhizobium fredii CCBAU 25509]